MTYQPKNLPVEDYLMAQGRFKHLSKEDLEMIQEEVDRNWAELSQKEKMTAEGMKGRKKGKKKDYVD